MAATVMFKGIPISARRHSECYDIIAKIIDGNVKHSTIQVNRKDQGFITTHGRFVTREEAFLIAKRENQIYHKAFDSDDTGVLTSEDLW